ncbi:MAG TPA: sodium-dependent bicarbonate transport family permease [Longimicrobium sp.]|jgi:hypothetical protein|uniref:sodium-dependent bicarbonate transport family permease n=1 Tax=Longimicrobium sp. TaxID=2029185 RepID=UPI002ED7D458
MDMLELVRLNLLSPIILAFVLGIVATLARSDLKFPEPLYTALSIYLLLAIGLKGGAALSETPLRELGGPALATLALGIAVPLWSYAIVRRVGRMSVSDAAALAAHYGSVSVVTFIAALSFLDAARIGYEGFLPTLVAMLEVPAIIVALLLARMRGGAGRGSWGTVLHEVLAGRSILLLLGGLVIGAASGTAGLERVAPFFVAPFQGALVLFLLEMGMVAARRFRDLRTAGAFLLGFGVGMPLLHGVLGVWLGSVVGLSLGGSTVLGVMAASASYIAAPAAVRIALPEANPGYYLTAALAITFPFNLTVGIPVYFAVARWLHAGGAG